MKRDIKINVYLIENTCVTLTTLDSILSEIAREVIRGYETDGFLTSYFLVPLEDDGTSTELALGRFRTRSARLGVRRDDLADSNRVRGCSRAMRAIPIARGKSNGSQDDKDAQKVSRKTSREASRSFGCPVKTQVRS